MFWDQHDNPWVRVNVKARGVGEGIEPVYDGRLADGQVVEVVVSRRDEDDRGLRE